MAKAIAQYWIGDVEPAPLLHIDCQNYQQSHELAKLIGAPPGYIGYDNEPLLSQRKINESHLKILNKTNKIFVQDVKNAEEQMNGLKIFFQMTGDEKQYKKEADRIYSPLHEKYGNLKSIILFDEIEKAHYKFWDFVLNIISEGKLTFHNPLFGEVSFSNSVLVFTTNIGAEEIQKVLTGRHIGFGGNHDDWTESDQRIYNAVKASLEKTFPPEFLGRIKENIIVFHPLKMSDKEEILEIQLNKLKKRFSEMRVYLRWNFTDSFRKFILGKSSDNKYGIRVLNQKIEKYVENSICLALESGQVKSGNEILFDVKDEKVRLWVKQLKKKLFIIGPGYHNPGYQS